MAARLPRYRSFTTRESGLDRPKSGWQARLDGYMMHLRETTPRAMDLSLETAGETEMAMRMKRVLYSLVALCALAGALYVPAQAAGLNIETATIADLNAAFADGSLTSEQLVSAYLKRIEAYDKQGPAINAIITLNKKALDEARQL